MKIRPLCPFSVRLIRPLCPSLWLFPLNRQHISSMTALPAASLYPYAVEPDGSPCRHAVGYPNICVSPRGRLVWWGLFPHRRLLPWGPREPHIEEISEDGRTSLLTSFGWFPAFSPDGTMFAFCVGRDELWLKKADEKPERILSLPEIKGFEHELPKDHAIWCGCSQHFALKLGPPTDSRRPLIIVNVATKEVIVRQDLDSHGFSQRVWVPKDKLMPLFKAQEKG